MPVRDDASESLVIASLWLKKYAAKPRRLLSKAGPLARHSDRDLTPPDPGGGRWNLTGGHMCPSCLTAAATLATGVVSSGGLAALMLATLGRKPNTHQQGADHGTAENRDTR